MITLKCPNCKEIWNYKGRKKVYASCPDCRFAVKIKDNLFNPLVSEKEEADMGDEKFWKAVAGDDELK